MCDSSLLQTGDRPPPHYGLVTVVDMDTQEYPNGIVATVHVVLNLFLEKDVPKIIDHNYSCAKLLMGM